jgi:hypothetical protein
MAANLKYDVFISYAREDIDWVRPQLYEPLCRTRLPDGRRPRIFFDLSAEGIAVGQNFMDAILQAIKESPRVVPVYSVNYFRKEMCLYELGKAHDYDLLGTKRKLNPILLDPQYAGRVPDRVSHIHYWCATSADWFARLCEGLDLVPESEQAVLEFLDQPRDLPVNHTLPPLRVAIKTPGGAPLKQDEEISINAEGANLQGAVSSRTSKGVATFTDLSVGSSASSVCLVARADGMESARSVPFRVVEPPAPRRPKTPPTIASEGEAIFFAGGRAVLVLHQTVVRAYTAAGQSLLPSGEVTLPGRLRLVRRAGTQIALADWSGNVLLISESGHSQCWAFGGSQGGLVVPGDLAFDDRYLYAGFWSGALFRLSLTEPPQLVLQHAPGVQALAVVGGRFYVSDFDGGLAVFQPDGHRINTETLEPAVWLLRASARGLLAIGDQRAYQVRLAPLVVLSEQLPLGTLTDVFGDSDHPVLLDERGGGARVNAELIFRRRFHVPLGSVPVSADQGGAYCVFRNPDGVCTLLKDDRTVFSHTDGTLALSPGGDRFAVGEPGGIRILDRMAFERLLQGDGSHA